MKWILLTLYVLLSNLFKRIKRVTLFHVALLRGIVDKGNGIRLLKIPNAGVSAERKPQQELGHEKKNPTFHYTGWLIGIRSIMVYEIIPI